MCDCALIHFLQMMVMLSYPMWLGQATVTLGNYVSKNDRITRCKETSPRTTVRRRKATCRPEISIGWFYKPEINLYSFESLKCCKLLVTTANTTLINILVNCHLDRFRLKHTPGLVNKTKAWFPPATLPSAISPYIWTTMQRPSIFYSPFFSQIDSCRLQEENVY